MWIFLCCWLLLLLVVFAISLLWRQTICISSYRSMYPFWNTTNCHRSLTICTVPFIVYFVLLLHGQSGDLNTYTSIIQQFFSDLRWKLFLLWLYFCQSQRTVYNTINYSNGWQQTKNNGQLEKTKQREQTNKGIMIFLTFRHIECVDSTLAVTIQYTRYTLHWDTQTTSMLRKLAETKALCYAKTRRKSRRNELLHLQYLNLIVADNKTPHETSFNHI